MAKRNIERVQATYGYIRGTRHRELVGTCAIVTIVGSSIDTRAGVSSVQVALVLVNKFQLVHAKGHGPYLEVGVDGDIQAFQIAVVDNQPGRDHAIGVMAKGDTQLVHPRDRHIRRARQHELVVVDVVGLCRVIGIGIDAGSLVRLTGGELTQVLVGELQVLGSKNDRAHPELGVDGDVQAFQIAVVDRQAGGHHAISVVAKGHTELVHARD